jgi:hypothetical protein
LSGHRRLHVDVHLQCDRAAHGLGESIGAISGRKMREIEFGVDGGQGAI